MEIKYVDRRHTNCVKWDPSLREAGTDDAISLGCADMDFEVAPAITEALRKYVDFGVFGYYDIPASYLEAFCRYEKEVHGNEIDPQWVRFSSGCVPAINLLVQVFTNPGDAVLAHSPAYPPFKNAPVETGRKLILSELVNNRGEYSIDFEDFEKKIIENDVKCYILCSPHNPVGRVWEKEELLRLFEICRKHHVFVISDEIHHNIILPGFHHTSVVQLKEYYDMTAILMAPSKTFNLAAMSNSMVVVPDESLRERVTQRIQENHAMGGNAFGYIAAEAAYNGGREWFQSVLKVFEENYRYVKDRLAKELPRAVVSPLQGTYLMWIDMGAYIKGDELEEFLTRKCHLFPGMGYHYGGDSCKTFMRYNLATSKEILAESLDRIIKELNK